MTIRAQLFELLSRDPRSVSSLARELHLAKRDADGHLRHLIRTTRAAGHDVVMIPARCRTCGFEFDEDKLTKPGKCPSCRGTRIIEAMLRIA